MHDNSIKHDDKMCPAIKSFYIVFSTMFTAYLKDFWLIQ